MSPPLALPQPLSSLAQQSAVTGRAGFTLETRRLLGRLPAERGLWVVEDGTPRAEGQARAEAGGAWPRPYTDAGRPAGLAHYFLLGALLRGQRALFLDAANCFNPHRLVEMIARVNERRQGALRPAAAGSGQARPCPIQAEELLARVRLSRAFTCFQLAELVERVPAAARRWGARCVFVTGVPEIFDDEELQEAEVRRVFSRALAGMRRWRTNERNLPLSTLVFTAVLTPLRPEPSGPQRWLAAQLERAADGIFRFQETPAGLAVRGGEKRPALCASSAFSAPACRRQASAVRPYYPGSLPLRRRGRREDGAREKVHGPHHRHLPSVD